MLPIHVRSKDIQQSADLGYFYCNDMGFLILKKSYTMQDRRDTFVCAGMYNI